jgi:hypothetical protein
MRQSPFWQKNLRIATLYMPNSTMTASAAAFHPIPYTAVYLVM